MFAQNCPSDGRQYIVHLNNNVVYASTFTTAYYYNKN